jgi:hypothetical protein
MSKASVIVLLLFLLSGCNPYTQFYTDFTNGRNITEDPDYIISSGKPKLIYGSNIQDDFKRMAENGYVLIGASSFNAATVDKNLAMDHAKKIHADTVIVYSEYTNTVSGSMPLTVPDTQTSYHSGSIYGSGGGFANYYGSSTTYGTRTAYMPYSVRRYDYYASYWVKAKPPSLGVYVDDLTDELRREIESNKGVCIMAVAKDSPAFHNDLLAGDVIRKINDTEVVDKVHFMKIISENKGKLIEIEIYRNGKTIVKQIQLN